jgi:Putative DNA-binding domain
VSAGDPEGSRSLGLLQGWFQAVVTHPDGVGEGAASEAAQGLIRLPRGEIEKVIRRSSRLSAEERLGVYAHAYYARLLECLGEVYPVLRTALGAEVFDSFAFEYLGRYPSRSYTLNRLGDRFPAFLAETRPDLDAAGRPPAEASWPDFLIDLARLEWAVGQVFDGPGVEGKPLLAAEDLQAVDPERFGAARLEPVVCLRLLSFRFPVNAYYTAVRHAAEGEEVPIPPAAEERVALTRRDFVVRRYPLTRLQHVLLEALSAGKPVAEAIAATAAQSDLDDDALAAEIRGWFRFWTLQGFFQRLVLADPESD